MILAQLAPHPNAIAALLAWLTAISLPDSDDT